LGRSFPPYKGDFKKAWNNCKFRHCTAIVGDKLYKCTHLLHVYDAVQNGVMDAEAWKDALTYEPLTLQSTAEEIVAHLWGREIPECTICPDNPIFAPARQIPLKSEPQS
jgi:hypothetical protein